MKTRDKDGKDMRKSSRMRSTHRTHLKKKFAAIPLETP